MEAATLGRASHPFEVTGLSIDTRTIKPGDLFVALKGDNRDGHEFVAAAFAAKAAAALVSRVPEGIAADHALLEVAHTQRALEDLARASRTRSRAKIVAVTGSAGKTTTKEILRHALGALGEVTSSTASYNNHWGVPFSLASLPRHAAFGVFEVGMNHFGEIAFLSDLVRPHVAIITTIAPAHLEFFGNCDSIADAKSEIFGTVVPGGCALVPGDIAQSGRLLARAQQAGVSHILTFGSSENCDARLQSFEDVEGGLRFSAVICGTPVEARLEASGRHIAINAVAALAAVKFLDGDLFNAAAALKVFAPMKGRGQRHEAAGAMVIDESYNANPASMAAALAVLSRAKGRKLAVLGDMLELGTDSTRLHAELGGEIEKAGVDLVFLCGDQMRSLWDALPKSMRGAFAQTSSELVDPVSGALRAGDTVLVKGSNGSRMSMIVDALKART
ncbi:MAG: UDP-N-acetylmuramoyl-tripeptide--D-alanyl-D-alanine ligase [Alphaproteobacteria bacterium]|nr:UDP-N-acetylmuramoyl-tripeptide--D-alanyl-D-alanine ligase [Alphaproteobacteria bacterium]